MVIVRAPVRISFGGGGTDLATYYSRHGGFVLSAAIDRYASVMAQRPVDRAIRITSSDYGLTEAWPIGRFPEVCEPLALPKAAVARFANHGLAEMGVDLFLASEVPPGTGLGSSSAMAVALVKALGIYTDHDCAPDGVADIACSLEIDYLSQPIGKQDQYASAFGGINTIELSPSGVTVTPLRLPASLQAALDERLLLFATGQSRDSASILTQQRHDSGVNPAVIEALHRIKALAWDMCAALSAHDLDGFGRLLDRGWQEKKSLSSAITTAAIDEWYTAARDAGALGGKITGAGGGGYLLLYCPPERQARLRAVMTARGLEEQVFRFDEQGVQDVATPGIAAQRATTRLHPLQRTIVALPGTGRTDKNMFTIAKGTLDAPAD